MAYITVNEYCTITGTDLSTLSPSKQERINFLLEMAQSYTDGLFGGDKITLKQRTQRISCCDILCSCDTNSILLCALQVQSIDEIDGEVYTGVIREDYYIDEPNQRRIIFKNYPFGSRDFGNMQIKFTSGFATIPSDIQYLQTLFVQSELAKSDGQLLKSYKLRDRTVTFADPDGTGSARSQAKMIAQKYYTYCE